MATAPIKPTFLYFNCGDDNCLRIKIANSDLTSTAPSPSAVSKQKPYQKRISSEGMSERTEIREPWQLEDTKGGSKTHTHTHTHTHNEQNRPCGSFDFLLGVENSSGAVHATAAAAAEEAAAEDDATVGEGEEVAEALFTLSRAKIFSSLRTCVSGRASR